MEVFANMDSGTATLILQLQLEDSNELFESCEGKGKGREGVLSDSQFAFQTYKEDLERTAAIVADRKMSSGIARACELDGNIVVLYNHCLKNWLRQEIETLPARWAAWPPIVRFHHGRLVLSFLTRRF